MKHLTTLFELSADDIRGILELTAALKAKFQQGERPGLLAGRVLAQVFDKPSLRTRVSFEAAIMQLGGSSTFLSSKEAGLQGRESLPDVARVLSSYCDAIVLRTFSQSVVDEFARHSRCPVINGLSDERHPCQALSDVFTIQEVAGKARGQRLTFIGDGNNMAASLAIAAAIIGMPITLCGPPDYRLSDAFLADLKRRFPKARIRTTADPQQAVARADFLYTDVWASMGQESQADARKKEFAKYQVDAALLSRAPAECRFMHCLPAHRGEEVTDDVLDSPRSIVLQQAENRMHLAKGLLVWLLSNS